MRRPSRVVGQSVVGLLLLLLAACSAPGATDTGAGPREWRDLELVVPSGWTVIADRTDLLHIANEDIGGGPDATRPPVTDPDAVDVVGVQFTASSGSTPDAYRELVQLEGGEVESDERIEIGGLPATSIVYTWASNGTPSRERVVFVPSRDVYLLLQPVPVQGQTTGPDVYLRHTDEFEAILDSITFGRPFEG